MPDLKRVSFLIEDFPLRSPAQQLLDRFLIGFAQDGVFTHPNLKVRVWAAQAQTAPLLQRRVADHGLELAANLEEAISGAEALVIVGAAEQLGPNPATVRQALERASAGTPVFVYGLIAAEPGEVKPLLDLAMARKCPLWASTAVQYGFLLPPVTFPGPVLEMLVVVQGRRPLAELEALETLWRVIPDHAAAHLESVRRVRLFENDNLWHAADDGFWSWRLLSSALSRSDTPQGNALKDGRTEDLVGLGLVRRLARHPRGWILEHAGGLRTALLVLDGVVADINFAATLANGQSVSAQLFRTAAPQEEEFSGLAAAVMAWFLPEKPVLRPGRVLAEARILTAMQTAADTWSHVLEHSDQE